jgi:hypothetical protein
MLSWYKREEVEAMGFFARVGKVKVYSTKSGPKVSISSKKKKK